MNTFNSIIEINEMIDLLEDFFSNKRTNSLIVGQMVGCHLQDYVLDAALKEHALEEILYVQGCQDYIDVINKKNVSRFAQYVFYADLFTECRTEGLGDTSVLIPEFQRAVPEIVNNVDVYRISQYRVMIIQDAHLIPDFRLHALVNAFVGHVVMVVDPFDVHGERFSDSSVYAITNAFKPMTSIKGFARALYNVDSNTDKNSKGMITRAKISNRSIGKVDNRQYISNDQDLIEMVQSRQLQSPFRKNYKVMVNTDRIIHTNRPSGLYLPSITRYSMLIVDSIRVSPFMRLKLFATDIEVFNDITYLQDRKDLVSIPISPANILSIKDAVYHRYTNAVLVLNENLPMTTRERYSVIKNSANLLICDA